VAWTTGTEGAEVGSEEEEDEVVEEEAVGGFGSVKFSKEEQKSFCVRVVML
jgi:hypothetical protein